MGKETKYHNQLTWDGNELPVRELQTKSFRFSWKITLLNSVILLPVSVVEWVVCMLGRPLPLVRAYSWNRFFLYASAPLLLRSQTESFSEIIISLFYLRCWLSLSPSVWWRTRIRRLWSRRCRLCARTTNSGWNGDVANATRTSTAAAKS